MPADVEALLRSWTPPRGGLARLRGLHAGALNGAVARRCVELLIARRALDDVVARAREAVARAPDSSWTRPEVAFAHYVALRERGASEADLRTSVASLLEVCGGDAPPTDFRGVRESTEWVQYGLLALVDDTRRDGREVAVHAANPEPADVEGCRVALDMLRKSWPEMAAAIDVFTRQVVWFQSASPPSAGTQVQTFGAVFLATDRGLARTLERLVHETTHLELVARMALDKLIVNGGEHDISPFRSKPRPLSRVLHAAMVSRRVIEALERSVNMLPNDEQNTANKISDRYGRSLDAAVASLERAARWTPTGRSLFDTLSGSPPQAARPAQPHRADARRRIREQLTPAGEPTTHHEQTPS